MFVVE